MDINSYKNFLDIWFEEINKVGIDTTGFTLDHLGYSVSTSEEYDQAKKELLRVSELVKEPLVSERRVGVFKFKKPLFYQKYSVSAIELIEPKTGETTKNGYEHAEFTINIPLENLEQKYLQLPWDTTNMKRPVFARLKLVFPNGMEVKFNNEPILQS